MQNQVRIIAGSLRGRKLSFANTLNLRPTPDRVRETVFNWLVPMIEGAICLDLFAGSGAFSFEAISRGAKKVVAVENHPKVVSALQQHQKQWSLGNLELLQMDALAYLKQLNISLTETFDIIFLDPPYHSSLLVESIALLKNNPCLKEGSYVYLEFNQKITSELLPDNWDIIREKKAGNIFFYLVMVGLRRNDF